MILKEWAGKMIAPVSSAINGQLNGILNRNIKEYHSQGKASVLTLKFKTVGNGRFEGSTAGTLFHSAEFHKLILILMTSTRRHIITACSNSRAENRQKIALSLPPHAVENFELSFIH